MDIVKRIQDNFPALSAQMDQVPAQFAPGWLKDGAVQASGLSDFGSDTYEEPLDRLCASLNTEADLNAYGRFMVAAIIRNQLRNRLLLEKTRRQTPDRVAAPLLGPIIVTGLPRTGTTFLHRLLAADPAHAFLPYWQVTRPIPLGPDDTPEARINEADQFLDVRRALTPELDGIHLMRAESPEECLWMTGTSLRTRLFFNLAPVYAYQHWLSRSDKTPKYADYAATLRFLQGEYPGQRLILKAPDHNDGVSELLDAIPEARVVLTHRDILAQMGSYFSLGRTTRTLAVNRLDPAREAAAIVDMTDVALQKMEAARSKHPGRILDIRYSDMMADPLRTVETIYAFCGLALPDDRRHAIADHHAKNPQGKHGGHAYSLAEFGLDDGWVRNRYRHYETSFVR